ncbi:MAG: 16S rRNA (guanine(966)-N(2))-methyltransferase RsmD [Betaproteobacteria bacterium]|jgi:16S rRNA (guanine966-N2)-methyltransferase|nr:16S rRNA (guanine(966)-N(2))-methyltransferase RsmD [Betaproteobacteria bacterium]NBO94557.1 16S rRNA (guanine(966)-N(2))-methyltransferase RsmD [Betaproteobacteria bacterium]NBP34374.1 16S rRNA (guanine(966)-N(2))-methyltransferase RsmD [Betaproteobacteria bacterium]NBP36944.1 16S rRNA (guanine(966)-N(2))-methyltransferase RsmD [Betaproteobacteria bacterium]NBQ77409.1 16S rRNA (guanine(966)-N(2))-methyltransferase RsmD [Betaproteobacteria bacterium]
MPLAASGTRFIAPKQPKGSGHLRIIAGQWRSRRIEVAAVEGLRPTPDRVRQTLFDWLQHLWAGQGQDLSGMRVLDAFAGTGALGFEAGSRGASEVLFIERHPLASDAIARQMASFKAAKLRLIKGDAMQTMKTLALHPARFDLVLLDPPFSLQLALSAAQLALPLFSENGLLYLEAPQRWEQLLRVADEPLRDRLDDAFVVLRQAKAGSVHYHLLQRNTKATPSPKP